MQSSIGRHEIVEAAEHALEGVANDALVDEIMEIARTEPVLSINWSDQYLSGGKTLECGCLVGTWRMRRGLDPEPISCVEGVFEEVQYEIGMQFYRYLRDECGAGGIDVYEIDDNAV